MYKYLNQDYNLLCHSYSVQKSASTKNSPLQKHIQEW